MLRQEMSDSQILGFLSCLLRPASYLRGMERNLEIESIFTGEKWQGSQDLPADDSEALNIISRSFSRVDEADCDRLEEIGYRLPSISVGDRVRIDGRDYWADTIGWTDTWAKLPAYARAIPRLRDQK